MEITILILSFVYLISICGTAELLRTSAIKTNEKVGMGTTIIIFIPFFNTILTLAYIVMLILEKCTNLINQDVKEENRNDPLYFESLGAHLRNLLTPYANIIQLVNDLKKAKEENNIDKYEFYLHMIINANLNNLEELTKFSQIKEMENINYKTIENNK